MIILTSTQIKREDVRASIHIIQKGNILIDQ